MTVASTAMPTVVGDLGGIHLYSWVFTGYLLTSTVTVPLYGKLADLYGRKPVLLFGIALFLVIVSYLSWRWAFFINVPAGICAAALLVVALHEHVERHQHSLDILGAGVLMLGTDESAAQVGPVSFASRGWSTHLREAIIPVPVVVAPS